MIAYAAASHVTAAQSVLARINDVILFPLMTLMVSVAVLVFLWGVFQYVYNSGDEKARGAGRMHMLYGVIGLFIMLSAFAILKVAAGTFGVSP